MSKHVISAKEEETKDVDTTEPTAEAAEGTTEGTTTDEGQTTSDPQDQPQGGCTGSRSRPKQHSIRAPVGPGLAQLGPTGAHLGM